MIKVYEWVGERRNILGSFATFAEAEAFAQTLGLAFYEGDDDYTDCADMLTNDGRVVSIQPETLHLN